jgi:hypothetical protein
MATIKTSELSGKALDYAVFLCLDDTLKQPELGLIRHKFGYGKFNPSTNWADGGPIIEREIDVLRKRSKAEEASLAYPNPNFKFKAEKFPDISGYFCGFGPTPLLAAMRCFVASNIGDSVEIPDELLKAPTNCGGFSLCPLFYAIQSGLHFLEVDNMKEQTFPANKSPAFFSGYDEMHAKISAIGWECAREQFNAKYPPGKPVNLGVEGLQRAHGEYAALCDTMKA